MFIGFSFILMLAASTVKSGHDQKMDEDMVFFWRRSSNVECKPFTTFQLDCNKCVCGADATSYCTRMICKSRNGFPTLHPPMEQLRYTEERVDRNHNLMVKHLLPALEN